MSGKCIVCGKNKGYNKMFCSQKCRAEYLSHKRKCVICGKYFYAPPSSQKKTCGSECERKNRVEIGKTNPKVIESLQKAHSALKKSPNSGSFETNSRAKSWVIVSPDGTKYAINNLALWANEHADIIPSSPDRFADAIRTIKYTQMGKKKKGCFQHKGWTLEAFYDDNLSRRKDIMSESKVISPVQQGHSPHGWETDLVSLYDALLEAGEPICPVAHTYITAHICVLLDKNGNFLAAMSAPVDGELVAVPCTIESEARTSNIAPHLISDQVGYVTQYPKMEDRHAAYLEQLGKYVKAVPDDEYAAAVYKHVQTGLLMDEIHDLIPKINPSKANVVFSVYGIPSEGQDLKWTEYYVASLPKTDICSITGDLDYIPSSYPRDLRSPGDRARLFIAKQNPLDSMPGNSAGYVASQKCCHAIQYMAYGKDRHRISESIYMVTDYLNGEVSEEDLKKWFDKVAPHKWNTLMKILSGEIQDIEEVL